MPPCRHAAIPPFAGRWQPLAAVIGGVSVGCWVLLARVWSGAILDPALSADGLLLPRPRPRPLSCLGVLEKMADQTGATYGPAALAGRRNLSKPGSVLFPGSRQQPTPHPP